MINKETEGYYVLFTFECEAAFPAELGRVFKITEGLLRTMIIAL
jgi:small subunit ribosomal protein S6